MVHFSTAQIKSRIKDNMLIIDYELISHPAFSMLLRALGQSQITFSSPHVTTEGENASIVIEGRSTFFSVELNKSDFYLYDSPESEQKYEFEWHGTLPSVSFSALYSSGIVQRAPLNFITELLNGVFSEVDMLYTSRDKAFAIEVSSSGNNLDIPEIGLSLKEIGFYYERSLDNSIKTAYRLYSTIAIGSTTLPTEIELPAGNDLDPVCWSLKTTDIIILNNGLKDIVGFLSSQQDLNNALGSSIFDILPTAISAIPDFALTDLVIHFNPIKRFVQLVDFSVQSLQKFEIVPGFVLQDIGFTAFITLFSKNISCSPGLFGRFIFAESIEAGISIQLPLDPKSDWRMEMDGSADLQKLQDLESLPFIKLEDLHIPPEWLTINFIHMNYLKITYNPVEGKIKTVSFSLQLGAKSSLIPGITVKDPYLEFNLTFN